MKIELTRDTSVLLTKGNQYEVEMDLGYAVIRAKVEHRVPAEFYRVLDEVIAGVSMVRGATYDAAYLSYRGKPLNLRGWEFLRTIDLPYGRRSAAFMHRGSRKRQEIDVDRITGVTLVEAASA